MFCIKNIKVIDPLNQRHEIADILIGDDGNIKTIGKVEDNVQSFDGTGKIAYPGFVDIHVHFRDPGQTYKEDLISGANSAIVGGYTHVVCMANTKPIIDNVNLYQANQTKMETLPLNVYQAAAISQEFKGETLTDFAGLKDAGVRMLTDDGIPLKNKNFVQKAMEEAVKYDLPLSFHEEDPSYITYPGINEGKISAQLCFKGADRMAEIAMIKRDIALAKETGATINVQHISSKEGVALIKQAKMDGLNVHAEACPHHFTLNEEAVLKYGSLAKMNPPLRQEEDRIAIIEALKENVIDIIATDHAPHSREEKSQPLLKCPSGIIGLETAYCLANEILVKNHYLDEESLIERMAIQPGALIGIRAALDIGQKANIAIVDPNKRYTIKSFASKSSNSPFLGRECIGKVWMTIAKGEIVYHDEF